MLLKSVLKLRKMMKSVLLKKTTNTAECKTAAKDNKKCIDDAAE